jgi:hypothetical protein
MAATIKHGVDAIRDLFPESEDAGNAGNGVSEDDAGDGP